LVAAFERRQLHYRELLAHAPHSASERRDETIRSALGQLQQAFLDETRRLTMQCTATWANREFVLTQFLATVQRFFKKQGKAPKSKHGPPTKVHFHHRFAGGGFPIAGIFGRSQRLRFDPLSPNAHDPSLPQRQRKRFARTTGVFQVGKVMLPFQTLLHRPLPEGAYLKSAALIGRQVVRAGYHCHQDGGQHLPPRWTWSLQLTLEHPPHVLPSQEQKIPQGTLMLHRRIWDEEQLQIGVLVDSTGREEALLLPERILPAWRYKGELQKQADQACGETKKLLREIMQQVDLPLHSQQLLMHVSKVRTPGLWRLLQTLENAQETSEARKVIQRWAVRTTKLLREARGLERRYLNHRDWFYRNLALQLCHRYQQLTIAPHVPSSVPGPEREQTPLELQSDGNYRQLASPSVFLAFLKQAAAKTGTKIKESKLTESAFPHTRSAGFCSETDFGQ